MKRRQYQIAPSIGSMPGISSVLTTMSYKMMVKEMLLLLNDIAVEDVGLLTLFF